jgi:hypothetical protein
MSWMNDTKSTWVRCGLTALNFYGLVEYPRGVRISRLPFKAKCWSICDPSFYETMKNRRLETKQKRKRYTFKNHGPLVLLP